MRLITSTNSKENRSSMFRLSNAPKATGQDIYQVTLGGGHRLTLRRADITGEGWGGLVTAANGGLCHGGGGAGAIVRKGGMSIQTESFRAGRVNTGQAAI